MKTAIREAIRLRQRPVRTKEVRVESDRKLDEPMPWPKDYVMVTRDHALASKENR